MITAKFWNNIERYAPQVAVALSGLGLLLRLLGLSARPLWFDEAISAVYARQDVATLIRLNAGDNHPPGYYLGLKFWIDAFGSSEFALRLFSVLPGAAAVWLVWCIGRRLFPANPKIGLAATALTAFSPFQIYFSQEVRNYAIMEFSVLLATLCWLRALENNSWQSWTGLALAGTLGLVCNFTTAFYLAALGAYLFWDWRGNWQNGRLGRLFLTGAATGLLSAIALLPKLTGRLQTIRGNFWIPAPDPLVVLRTFYTFVFGAIQAERFVIAFLLALVLLLFVGGQVGAALISRKAETGVKIAAWLLVAPMLLLIIVSYLYQPLYLDKALIACAPFYYLLLGWTIFRQDRKRRGGWILTGVPTTLAVFLSLAALPDMYVGTINPLYIARYDASRINAYLNERAQPGDRVVAATDIAWLPLVYYSPNLPPPKLPLKEYPYPNIFDDLVNQLGSRWITKSELEGSNRFWVIFEVNAPENTLHQPPRPANLDSEPNWLHSPEPQRELLTWLNANFRRVEAVALDRVILVLYQRG
jgi:mannosyltransferase